jgi:phosphatidate phosphatase APP1
MGRLKRALTEIVASTDERIDRLRARARARRPVPEGIRIATFVGYGTGAVLSLSGRVLTDPTIGRASDGDTWRTNLRNMIRRLESDEVPDAVIRATLGEVTREVRADDEGYFHLELEPGKPIDLSRVWHEVDLELVEPLPASPLRPAAKGRVLVPPPDARFGVVSDVDDTIIWTNVSHKLRMAKIVFLDGARARLPFEGVAALYKAFQAGVSGAEGNPIFYVSGSPWNLYDLLAEIFEYHGIPEGPIRLRDFGSSPSGIFWKETAEHKLTEIRAIFDRYPTLPFVLIGDSGEKDPEIYRELVGEYPGRILAVYIRNVTDAGREPAIARLADEVRSAGSELVLARDSRFAAEHAAARGLILASALGPVEESAARDRASPGPSS